MSQATPESNLPQDTSNGGGAGVASTDSGVGSTGATNATDAAGTTAAADATNGSAATASTTAASSTSASTTATAVAATGEDSARPREIVAIGGAARAGSSSERLILAVAEQVAERTGAQIHTFGAEFLSSLPYAGSIWGDQTAEQKAFSEAAATADALIIGTPAYHGGIAGLVKNALDHLGDFEGPGGGRIAPVGVVVSGSDPLSIFNTVRALRDVTARMKGVPTPSAVAVNSKPAYTAEDGSLLPEVQEQVDTVAQEIIALLR